MIRIIFAAIGILVGWTATAAEPELNLVMECQYEPKASPQELYVFHVYWNGEIDDRQDKVIVDHRAADGSASRESVDSDADVWTSLPDGPSLYVDFKWKDSNAEIRYSTEAGYGILYRNAPALEEFISCTLK